MDTNINSEEQKEKPVKKPRKENKTYKLYDSKGQLKVTVPRVLAQAVGLKKNDDVAWLIDRGELVMKKVQG
jgi:hypothetical protein